jgi:hypothetical protein
MADSLNPNERDRDRAMRDVLSHLPVPEAAEDHADETLRLALQALHAPRNRSTDSTAADDSPSPFRWAIAGGLGLATASVVLAWTHLRSLDAGKNDHQPPVELLAEVESLFPGQVAAVVSDGRETRVELTDAPMETGTPTDQRVRVTLTKGTESLDVLTYSGRKVCVSLGDREVCLTPLIDQEGAIFLMTDTSVVQPASGETVAGFHLTVEHLRPNRS